MNKPRTVARLFYFIKTMNNFSKLTKQQFHLATVAIMLSCCTQANTQAQGMTVLEANGKLLPAEFTIDKKDYLTTSTTPSYSNYLPGLYIYNDDIELVKSLSFNVREEKLTTTTRQREPVYSYNGAGGQVFEGYIGDWTETTEEHNTTCGGAMRTELFKDGIHYNDLYITQSLFNDDEKYEYLTASYKKTVETVSENDRDGDGEPDYIVTEEKLKVDGLEIVQEDGTVLYRFTGDEGYTISQGEFYSLNGKLYFNLYEYGENSRYLLYAITPGGEASLIKATDVSTKASVSPRVVCRWQMVTVEVDDDTPSLREVIVSNAAGQTVYRTAIQPGHNMAQIPAALMGSGINVVTVKGAGRHPASYKVIVKP